MRARPQFPAVRVIAPEDLAQDQVPGFSPGVRAPPNPRETSISGRQRATKLSPASRAAASPMPETAATPGPGSNSQAGIPRSRRGRAPIRRKKGRTSRGSAAMIRTRQAPGLRAPRPAEAGDIKVWGATGGPGWPALEDTAPSGQGPSPPASDPANAAP